MPPPRPLLQRGRVARWNGLLAAGVAGLLAAVSWQAPAQVHQPTPTQTPTQDAPWPVAGRQGLTLNVIVPLAQVRDRAAYARQAALLCPAAQSCFINFFSNSTGAEVSMPLPEAITNEPTALFRRSTKQGAELFRWSCRLEMDSVNCF